MFLDAIIGGEYVVDPQKYPWMVNVVSFDIENNQTSDRFPELSKISSCGGAIISENIILTAAHCVKRGWSEYSVGRDYGKKTAIFVRVKHPRLDDSITVKAKSTSLKAFSHQRRAKPFNTLKSKAYSFEKIHF